MNIRYHWRFGRHSRIPICCIIAFIIDLSRRVPDTGESFAPCWGCYWLWRLGMRRHRTIHFCSPNRPGCREWIDGHELSFVDGVWMAHATIATITITIDP